MATIIESLFHFQQGYLEKLIQNIPDDRLYEKQLEGFNSAGWILGHICVEAEDVLDYLGIPYDPVDPDWRGWFRNTTGKITNLDGLPTKDMLLSEIKNRYAILMAAYKKLSVEQRSGRHPSRMLQEILPDLDSWFAHHLTTHISIHCGNITVWKKMLGLEVSGY